MSDTPITMIYHTMSLILLYVTTVIADVFQTYTMYILIVQDSWCFSDILIVQDSWCFSDILIVQDSWCFSDIFNCTR